MGTDFVGPRHAGGMLRAFGAWLTCLASAAAAVPLPFEQELSSRPAFDAGQGFGFESADAERFSARVPEGSYRVTVRVASRRSGSATLWAEQRRLVSREIELRRRRPVERSFIVNVRTPDLGELPDNAAGGKAVRLNAREADSPTWDDRLSVQLTGPAGARLEWIRIERVDVPILYLLGDSTVTDQPAPDGSWGQFLPRYFRPDIAVANHAESGESLKSFVTSHRLDKVLSTLRAGDWVMIQFGHNDQKQQWPQTYADAATTYRSWLRTYVAEIRARGATPLLVTSPERRNFDSDGRIRPTLADHAAAMRAVAREEHVALIDLNAASVRFYESLGPGVAPRAFAGNGDDRTHHNEYGGHQLARAVIEGLRTANRAATARLETYIADDAGHFDVSDPPLPDPERSR